MMGDVTGIEVAAGTCVLVRMQAGRHGSVPRLLAAYPLEVEGSPDERLALAETLHHIRRTRRFPRRASVVAWNLASAPADGTDGGILGPLIDAGFEIEDTLTPAAALALLAREPRLMPGRDSAAWLALNRGGAAIAVIVHGKLLYSREFAWQNRPLPTARVRLSRTQRQELLDRYLLVAHLGEELRHAFRVVADTHAERVDSVVTCGNLQDLRSLTMPLIEELDMEVETVDSLDGLAVSASLMDEIGDDAPAIRLACAAAGRQQLLAAEPRMSTRAGVAAAAVLAVGVGAWGLTRATSTPNDGAAPARPDAAAVAAPRVERSAVAAVPAPPAPAPPPKQEEPAAPAPDAASATPTSGRTQTSAPPSSSPAAPVGQPRSSLGAGQRQQFRPLPFVNSILVAPERRLAVIDGIIVREGDAVGSRVLIRIEPDAVLLEEPSGSQVRVPLRRRVGRE